MKNNHLKILIIAVIIILLSSFLWGYIYVNKKESDENNQQKVDYAIKIIKDSTFGDNIYNINSTKKDILEIEYQNQIYENIDKMLRHNAYTFNNPLIIYNPYGTNLLGINIYFKSNSFKKLSYKITTDDENINEFERELDNNSFYNKSKKYYGYQIIGLVPGEVNHITLKIKLKNNNIKKHVININFDMMSKNKLIIKKGIEKINPDDKSLLYPLINGERKIYDNYGIERVNLPYVKFKKEFRLLLMGDYMLYAYDNYNFIKLDRFGRILKIYNTGNFRMHHDYKMDEKNNKLVFLTTNPGSNTINDIVRYIDLKTGKSKELLNFKELLNDIYLKTITSNNIDNRFKRDWIHINSLEIIDGKDIIVSSRILSAIIYISDIYNDPKIEYIISPYKEFKDSKYKDLVLTKEGDFSNNSGQHSLNYIKVNKNNHKILFFNNSIPYNSFSKNYHINFKTLKNEKDLYSKIDIYNIDTVNKKYTLEKEFNVPYSFSQGSVQAYKNGYIVTSSLHKIIGDYDFNGNLKTEYLIDDRDDLTGATRYTFNNFWFK